MPSEFFNQYFVKNSKLLIFLFYKNNKKNMKKVPKNTICVFYHHLLIIEKGHREYKKVLQQNTVMCITKHGQIHIFCVFL